MKKFFKYLAFNLLILIAVFLILDYVYYKCIYNDYKTKCIKEGIPVLDEYKYKTYELYKPDKKSTTYIYKDFLGKELYLPPITFNINSNEEQPIILFGDSYTWLDADKGLQAQLSKYTKRRVYNFSFWCWGATHFYYLTHNPKLYDILQENGEKPVLAMYTYIRHHKMRLVSVVDYFVDNHPYLSYKDQNGKLVIQNNNFFSQLMYRFFSYRYLKYKTEHLSDKESYDLLFKLISESYFELKKHYPDIKFVVLYYFQNEAELEEEKEMFKKFQDIGIECIRTDELTKEDLLSAKYTKEDKMHPNLNAWNLICKPLSKKLKIIIEKN